LSEAAAERNNLLHHLEVMRNERRVGTCKTNRADKTRVNRAAMAETGGSVVYIGRSGQDQQLARAEAGQKNSLASEVPKSQAIKVSEK
jgi:hypothetical protein